MPMRTLLIDRRLFLASMVTLGLIIGVAVLLAGASAVSAQGSVPDAPGLPTTTTIFRGGVDLEWNDVPGADSYGVQVYGDGQWIDLPGAGVEIAFYGAGAIISGLDPDSTLWFQVRARNAHGFSGWSDLDSAPSTSQFKLGREDRPANMPASGAPVINGTAQVGETLTADTTGIEDGNGLERVQMRFQWVSYDGSTETDIADERDATYTIAASDDGKTIEVRVTFTDRGGYDETLKSAATNAVWTAREPSQLCSTVGGYAPMPTEVAIGDIPIVVESTTDEYFVLYVRHDLDMGATIYLPVSVTLGQAGSTTLSENVAAMPADRYRAHKFLIADPADVDGDCIDDITELADPQAQNPVNPSASIALTTGSVAIPDKETFDTLSYLNKYVKFLIIGMDTDNPSVYFMNTNTHFTHFSFMAAIGFEPNEDDPYDWPIRGEIIYDPALLAKHGDTGAPPYLYQIREEPSFAVVDMAHSLLAASMPVLQDNLSYYVRNENLASYQQEQPLYDDSRIDLIFQRDILSKTRYKALNSSVGYGQLRLMAQGDIPQSRDVVIYRSLPYELPRVAGIITTMRQTPLSHVNLRAIQDGTPNAYIKGAAEMGIIKAHIGDYVRYTVTNKGWDISSATREEVDAHYESSRSATPQTPQRDLSVTGITPLDQVGFDDWDAFGVKAANVAVLGSLALPEGTVPDGFAIPFYFYDEFMKHNDLYTRIETMLSDPNFQKDQDTQKSQLDELRDDIEDADTPAWILAALTDMNTQFPQGTTNRKYRSSTNNEDLPGFNGAGLYDSKSQKPSEDQDDISKSLKQVYASLWNFRAFTERHYHRIDHMQSAMGILVHPSYQDELVNGVAVSFDPLTGLEGYYYVNSQVGEDLVTNPDDLSYPEQILLNTMGANTILSTSNQVELGQTLMTDTQLDELQSSLTLIHNHFAGLYLPAPNEPFAMEIEFKITSENALAIKQARPWVFGPDTNNATATVSEDATLTALTVNDGATELTITPAFASDVTVYSAETINTVTTVTLTAITTSADAAVSMVTRNGSTITDNDPTDGITVPSLNIGINEVVVTVTAQNGTSQHYTLNINRAANIAPTATDSLITTNEDTAYPFVETDFNFVDSDSGDTMASVRIVTLPATGALALDGIELTQDQSVNAADIHGLLFTPEMDDNGTDYASFTFVVSDGTDDSPSAYTMTVNVTAVNDPATGAPTISGTAQVGETLTADTSDIADKDGMENATLGYRWISNDGAADIEIQGETSHAYILTGADEGKTVKVRVSFTDDADNEEGLTSEATGEVAGLPQPPLTARLSDTPDSHDGETDFTFELWFSEEFQLSYKRLKHYAFTVTAGTVQRAQRLEKGSNIGWRITVEPDSDSAVSIVLPTAADCNAAGAICTRDGRMLSNRLELIVTGQGP